MKYRRWALRLGLLYITTFAACLVWAGGPLTVTNGRPVLWSAEDFPIVYRVDPGSLGPYSHEEAAELIDEAFNAWQSAPNASIRFQGGALLPEDVDASNMYQYINGGSDGVNPVVFDDDGSIIRSLYGFGAEKDILGFAGPVLYSGGEITAAQAVFNGVVIYEANLSRGAVLSTVLHELGHLIGLDHSQLFRHLAYNYVGFDDVFSPIMLPTAADDDTFRTRLSVDDEHAIASLYPSEANGNTSSIRGVVRRGEDELPGVNVIAKRVGAVTDFVYSAVTGTYSYGGGEFEFTGLPEGDYILAVEPVDPSYSGVSSVGQYAEYSSDKSFSHPAPMQSYHIDEDASRSQWTPVTVRTRNTLVALDFVAHDEDATRDETDAVLLGFDAPEIGGASADSVPLFQYLFEPSGEESAVEITVRSSDPLAKFDVYAAKGSRVSYSDVPLQSAVDGIAVVRLGEGGGYRSRAGALFYRRSRDGFQRRFVYHTCIGSGRRHAAAHADGISNGDADGDFHSNDYPDENAEADPYSANDCDSDFHAHRDADGGGGESPFRIGRHRRGGRDLPARRGGS